MESDLRQKYELQIPNREVRIIFVDLAEKWIKNHFDLEQLEVLLKSLTWVIFLCLKENSSTFVWPL